MAASVPTVVRPCRRYNQFICYPEAKGAVNSYGEREVGGTLIYAGIFKNTHSIVPRPPGGPDFEN